MWPDRRSRNSLSFGGFLPSPVSAPDPVQVTVLPVPIPVRIPALRVTASVSIPAQVPALHVTVSVPFPAQVPASRVTASVPIPAQVPASIVPLPAPLRDVLPVSVLLYSPVCGLQLIRSFPYLPRTLFFLLVPFVFRLPAIWDISDIYFFEQHTPIMRKRVYDPFVSRISF